MKVLTNDLKYNVFEFLSKIAKFRGYSRSAPAVVGLCIHCEKIYDDTIYNKLLDFSRYFHGLTENKLIVCVPTPLNPVINQTLRDSNFQEDAYRRRLESLGDFCDIGYHGHFYSKKGEEFIAINGDNSNIEIATNQIEEEFDWFRRCGFKVHKYIAGWWYLNEAIVLKLESEGIEADFSIRGSGFDSFGGRYLSESSKPPLGRPFILPPSRRIVEIQMAFGPTSHPYRVGRLLRPCMNYSREENIYFVFAIHDWDLSSYYREIKGLVEFISEDSVDFVWSSFETDELENIRKVIGAI